MLDFTIDSDWRVNARVSVDILPRIVQHQQCCTISFFVTPLCPVSQVRRYIILQIYGKKAHILHPPPDKVECARVTI